MAKTYALPEEVRTAVLNYLMQRPYSEVALGVRLLEGLTEIMLTNSPAVASSPALAVVPDAVAEAPKG